jgi:hypothetical protein
MYAVSLSTAPEAGPVVTKAVLRVADKLAISQRDLARILGLSEASVSRLSSGRLTLDHGRKEGELALLLVRVFRSLDALVGDTAKAEAWFHTKNEHVGGVPAERVKTIEGLVHVAEYLDAMRGQL